MVTSSVASPGSVELWTAAWPGMEEVGGGSPCAVPAADAVHASDVPAACGAAVEEAVAPVAVGVALSEGLAAVVPVAEAAAAGLRLGLKGLPGAPAPSHAVLEPPTAAPTTFAWDVPGGATAGVVLSFPLGTEMACAMLEHIRPAEHEHMCRHCSVIDETARTLC